MPAPSPEIPVETLRRTLHAAIPHYAALLPLEMRHADVEKELIDLAARLGVDWPGDWSPRAYNSQRRRLSALLDSLVAAARADQEAAYQQRISNMMTSDPVGQAVPAVTAAVDRWLERWLSGKEAGRSP